MFCGKCGSQVSDNAKFCPNCGAQLIEPAASNTEAETGSVGTEASGEKKRKLFWIPIVIAVAAVVVVILLLAGLGVFSKQTVDLNEYVTVEFDGYEGLGTADVTLDTYALGEEHNDKIKLRSDAEDLGYYDFSDLLSDTVNVYAVPSSGLIDGDEVTLEWNVDLDTIDEMTRRKVELIYEPEEFKAGGLEAVESIDLNDYLTVEFSGIDGEGTATASFDMGSLGRDYNDKVALSEEASKEGYSSFSNLIRHVVNLYISADSGLSNGDEIEVTWDISEDDLAGMTVSDIDFIYSPETFTVSGLEVVETFDAFAGVSVDFTGTSPNASASIFIDDSARNLPEGAGDYLRYSLSKSEDITVGDVVTVSLDADSVNEMLENLRIYPETLSKDFEAEVAYYVSSLDQIPADAMDKMKQQAEDEFASSISGWSETRQLDSFDFIGNYFLYEKPGVNKKKVNIIYLVYKVHATQFGVEEDESEYSEPVEYYWYIYFQNAEYLGDGTFTLDYSNYSVSYGSSGIGTVNGEGFSYTTHNYTLSSIYRDYNITHIYSGYEDLDAMFNNVIVPMVDDYTYESTVQDQ